MQSSSTKKNLFLSLVPVVLSGVLAIQPNALAAGKTGSVDVAGAATGKPAGGKGGSSSKTTTAPAPAPGSSTLTFSVAAPVNGVVPVCSGTYSISPYYPTLYLLTTHVGVSSLNVPDGSLVLVTVNGPAGPISSGYVTVTAQSGAALFSSFIVPSTTVTNVTVSDSLGNILSTGL